MDLLRKIPGGQSLRVFSILLFLVIGLDRLFGGIIYAAGFRDGHEFCTEQDGQRQQRRNADGQNIVKFDHKTLTLFCLLSLYL